MNKKANKSAKGKISGQRASPAEGRENKVESATMKSPDGKQRAKSLYLIDISSLFFRSYYAISLNMRSKKGLPANALYGTLKMLNQLSKKKSPDYMIACFDSKSPSFRKKNLFRIQGQSGGNAGGSGGAGPFF